MTKEEASKLYLKLKTVHRTIKFAIYESLGESMNEDIAAAEQPILEALDKLAKIIDG